MFKFPKLIPLEVLALHYLFFCVLILISANVEEDWSIDGSKLDLSFVAHCHNSAAQVRALSSIRIQLPSILLYNFYCFEIVILQIY